MQNLLELQGRLADATLAAHKLTLTQGGEPTFVPHDTSAPEWNVEALGEEKLTYAMRLARQLSTRLFPGGVILRSFGKQYPGEALPRWQVGIYRARKGPPVWNDLNRLRLDQPSAPVSDPEIPQAFIRELAKALDLRSRGVAVYEDFATKLKATDAEAARRFLPKFSRTERAFVSRPLSQTGCRRWRTLIDPAGWVLPLDHDGEQWLTDKWTLSRGEELTLLAGDSPVGLRLPLKQLPEDVLRRGLSAEIKDAELVIFLPPMPTLDVFNELVRTIEQVSVKMGLPPFRLEGYRPPADEDLDWIALTADPGVLEVNLPPADNWSDLERTLRMVYTSAEAANLRGFKYQLSGRKVSTGGGAHIILGGPDLERNPFIERPILLSSFLRFLQNHPSLSYAFSGLFTGPSCQAPRVDESAYELPYELEITLAALESMPSPGDPWMIDALLRNLLMDWNGNTHRAELNVDKFHNYNAPNGRHGLIEFRAFEMVPAPDTLLAMNALIRALTACFAEQPYQNPLIDWREALHDRFAMPWFLRQDLGAVLDYVNGHGFSFESGMFDAHLDFRFPVLARFGTGAVRWTLRQALEPWPVMGDHQGTGRIVDATTDRLELLAEGISAKQSLGVAVNGNRMPLAKAGRGKAVGAIRYRLFDNPWGLQPHIKAHSPLQIEIVDLSSGKILYALDYRNWKEVGDYKAPPTNDKESAARVADRIEVREEVCGREAQLREVSTSPRAPFTLDLRRC